MNQENNFENNDEVKEPVEVEEQTTEIEEQPKEEKSVEPEVKPVEKEEVNPPKKRTGLIIFLILIIIALAGYIVYDKLIKNHKPTPGDSGEIGNDTGEKGKDAHEYFATEKVEKILNDKTINLEFKFWLEEDKPTEIDGETTYGYDGSVRYFVHCDLFFDGKLLRQVGIYPVYDSKDMNTEEVTNHINSDETYAEFVNRIKDVGVVKGDKEYLYIKDYSEGAQGVNSNIIVLNETGKEILTKKIEESGRGVVLDKTCAGYTSFIDTYKKDHMTEEEYPARYFISTTGIIYAEDDGGCDSNIITIYEISFKDDEAQYKEIYECPFEAEGACE